jgi:hypothetical protein
MMLKKLIEIRVKKMKNKNPKKTLNFHFQNFLNLGLKKLNLKVNLNHRKLKRIEISMLMSLNKKSLKNVSI